MSHAIDSLRAEIASLKALAMEFARTQERLVGENDPKDINTRLRALQASGGDTITPNPDGGGGSGALAGVGTITERLISIENAINFATLDIVCNEDGTITGTINWGVAPPPP